MLVHNFDCCISRFPGTFNCVDAARKKVKSSHARLIYIDYEKYISVPYLLHIRDMEGLSYEGVCVGLFWDVKNCGLRWEGRRDWVAGYGSGVRLIPADSGNLDLI